MRVFLPLTGLVLSASLLAQGAVPPFEILQTNPLPGLSPPLGSVGVAQVQQVCLIHLPSDPPSVYQCGLTVTSLFSYGGVGGSDLLAGTYDVTTDTFTPNSEAAALNTAGTEFGLQIHRSGLLAVFDRLPGPPHLATRTAVGLPWVDVGAINPLPSQSYYDPSLADYHGQTWLLHVLGTDIAMTPINPASGATTGPSVVIIHPTIAGYTMNSPTPILDANGQLIGVSHHQTDNIADNDHYLSLDLDPNTPAVLMTDTTTWINNGAFIGGRFFDAEWTGSVYNVFAKDTFWCPGGRAQIGGTMTVDFYSPPTAGPELYLSALLVSGSFLPTPVAIPGLAGQLGIALTGAAWSGLYLHNNVNGTGSTSFSVPNNPALHNLRLPVQSATLEVLSAVLTLANTAALIIE